MKREKSALKLLDSLRPELGNLALFGLERDDSDLSWHWKDVGELISECNDPARPPMRGCNSKFLHWKLRRLVENIYFRIFTFLLIILDVGLVIAENAIDCSSDPISIQIRNLDAAITVYFVVEVFLRIIALTPKVFFSKKSWHNIVDFVVVILAFGATIAVFAIIDGYNEDEGKNLCEKDIKDEDDYFEKRTSVGKLLSVLRIIRIFRFVRLFRLYFEHRRLVKGVRQRISENKRRFQVDGYDLDLTYILTNVIAMSFPSKGTKALYRNKIDNVAKFFEEKYSNEEKIDYMIYNLCSEMEYDHRKFHLNVKRFRIDDHNVPTLEMMFELTDSVREWLAGDRERERVVALHCKGGKGRTGTMICAILIDMGLFKEATDSLQYFGQRRTDLNVSKQFQGVETYSQVGRPWPVLAVLILLTLDKIRALLPITAVSKDQRGSLRPSHSYRVKHHRYHCSKILLRINPWIEGLKKVGLGDGSDFSVTIYSGGQKVIQTGFNQGEVCTRNYLEKRDLVSVTFSSPPRIDRDTKFMFHCSTKGVPVGYDDCAFFFWLHTYFIKNSREFLTREQMDNPHKEKTWAVWKEDFTVEVLFAKVLQ